MDTTATSAATVPTGAPTAVAHPNGDLGGRARLVDALRAVVGPDQIQTDPDITAAFSRDMMPLAPSGTPLAVVFPTETAQVAAVVKACAASGVPIVPRGAGSGLTGAANAVDGAV
ncbi:MAG TPA: FAD-binding protein, partial [Nakamurella sp.]